MGSPRIALMVAAEAPAVGSWGFGGLGVWWGGRWGVGVGGVSGDREA
jgi:hypothetical protein